MKRVNAIWERAQMLDEPLPGQSVLEVYGDERILIECHKGILEYGSEQISVRLRFGRVCVYGENLKLRKMQAQQLVITGKIVNIMLNREEKNGF